MAITLYSFFSHNSVTFFVGNCHGCLLWMINNLTMSIRTGIWRFRESKKTPGICYISECCGAGTIFWYSM